MKRLPVADFPGRPGKARFVLIIQCSASRRAVYSDTFTVLQPLTGWHREGHERFIDL